MKYCVPEKGSIYTQEETMSKTVEQCELNGNYDSKMGGIYT